MDLRSPLRLRRRRTVRPLRRTILAPRTAAFPAPWIDAAPGPVGRRHSGAPTRRAGRGSRVRRQTRVLFLLTRSAPSGAPAWQSGTLVIVNEVTVNEPLLSEDEFSGLLEGERQSESASPQRFHSVLDHDPPTPSRIATGPPTGSPYFDLIVC